MDLTLALRGIAGKMGRKDISELAPDFVLGAGRATDGLGGPTH